MASNARKKTTFAKLNREAKVRERRQLKQAKKEARRSEPSTLLPPLSEVPAIPVPAESEQPDWEAELTVVIWAVALIAVFAPLSVRLYRRKAL